MSALTAFQPAANGSMKLAVTTTSASITLAANPGEVLIVNDSASAATVFVTVGSTATVPTSTQTATHGMAIAPGAHRLITQSGNTIAAICDTGGSATLWVTPGSGF